MHYLDDIPDSAGKRVAIITARQIGKKRRMMGK
jgi:hypothetical protein